MNIFEKIEDPFDPIKAGLKKSVQWGNPKRWGLESTFYEAYKQYKTDKYNYYELDVIYFPETFNRAVHLPDGDGGYIHDAKNILYISVGSFGICYKGPLKNIMEFEIFIQDFLSRYKKHYA